MALVTLRRAEPPNPFDIELVARRILEFLHDDDEDVIQYRLLNSAFNDVVSADILQQDRIMKVEAGNILEYLALVNATGKLAPVRKFAVSITGKVNEEATYDGIEQLIKLLGQDSLGSVSCVLSDDTGTQKSQLKLLAKIMGGVPTLRAIHLDFIYTELNDETKRLRRDEVISEAWKAIPSTLGLVEFTTILDSKKTYDALARTKFPNLEKLTLLMNCSRCRQSARVLGEFLQINCPRLTRLELRFIENVTDEIFHGNDWHRLGYPVGLLPLSKLKHFGFTVRREKGDEAPMAIIPMTHFVRLNHINPLAFPNLNTVTINNGTMLQPGGYCQRMFLEFSPEILSMGYGVAPMVGLQVEYRTVSTLNLIIDSLEMLYDNEDMEETKNQLQAAFPNIRNLAIMNQFVPNQENITRTVSTLVGAIPDYAGLERLEVRNYYQGIFDGLILPLRGATPKFGTLKELRVHRNENWVRKYLRTRTGTGLSSMHSIDMHALLAANHDLKLVEVHRSLLRGGGPSSVAIDVAVEDLRASFPGVTINII